MVSSCVRALGPFGSACHSLWMPESGAVAMAQAWRAAAERVALVHRIGDEPGAAAHAYVEEEGEGRGGNISIAAIDAEIFDPSDFEDFNSGRVIREYSILSKYHHPLFPVTPRLGTKFRTRASAICGFLSIAGLYRIIQ